MKTLTIIYLALLSACSGCGGGGGDDIDQTGVASAMTVELPTVRFVYFLPSDTVEQPIYSTVIEKAASSVKSWFGTQLAGKTFQIEGKVETCHGSQPGAYYSTQSWSRVLAAVNECFNRQVGNFSQHRWVIYADVRHQCNQPEPLGAAIPGVAILPVQDLQGLAGETDIMTDCGKKDYFSGPANVNRWVGGLAHEIGHSLGLSHPPGCDGVADIKAPGCDVGSLMWQGYSRFPDTYLRADNKSALEGNPFLM